MYLGKTKIGTAGRNTIHRPLGEGGPAGFNACGTTSGLDRSSL